MTLWTNHPLVAEEAHRSFGAELIGQVYELDLRPLLA
jgi:hypothetical protein